MPFWRSVYERQGRGVDVIPDNYVSGYTDPWYYNNPERFQEVRSACCKMTPDERIFAQKLSFSGYEREPFFYNTGGKFEEIAGATGLWRLEDGRSFIRIDFDRDGDEDLFLWNYRQNTIKLLRNEYGSRHAFISIQLRDKSANTHGVGARIVADTGSSKHLRYLNCGEGYLSCHPAEANIGLGDAAKVAITIVWPDGTEQKFADVPTRAWYVAEKGAKELRRLEIKGAETVALPPPPRAPIGLGETLEIPEAPQDGVVAILASIEEAPEIAALKGRGVQVWALPEDVEGLVTHVKDVPGCRVLPLPAQARDAAIGAGHRLPCILVIEKGKVAAKFIGVDAGKRAAEWMKTGH